MLFEKSIIGIDVADGHDLSCATLKWNNDGTYTENCVNAPIIDKRTNGKDTKCVGYITSVDDEFVYGLIWGRYLTIELLHNLKINVSIEMG